MPLPADRTARLFINKSML